ncbi:hypothetical protein KC19_4G208400 [Ceratodon purpureus]|uniref:Uncharacterized protein n=1 Tax=Ceratodon purpureus TaxID=3225 RepID=A0A8T0IB20_CERPU|nr:hypothetical protein KC19_4G208400 [Ceratodon purpureus]
MSAGARLQALLVSLSSLGGRIRAECGHMGMTQRNVLYQLELGASMEFQFPNGHNSFPRTGMYQNM